MQHETFGATLKHSMKYCHIETNNHHNIETFGVTFGEILQHFSEASLKLQESLSKHCEKADANVTKTKSRMNIMNRTPQHHENYTGDPWCEGPCSAARGEKARRCSGTEACPRDMLRCHQLAGSRLHHRRLRGLLLLRP